MTNPFYKKDLCASSSLSICLTMSRKNVDSRVTLTLDWEIDGHLFTAKATLISGNEILRNGDVPPG